ncbi:pinin-like [Salvia splendens]|uniref:pinin-like n=1 Tax=Salvia splendens TaxID=180675 RepID=UPI001C26845C|nr:pinin-like [Salvia splendens]
MASTVMAEKTEAELRKEIDELRRQQREITERLRDPRGIRRGGLTSAGPRNFAPNGSRQRGFVRSVNFSTSLCRCPFIFPSLFHNRLNVSVENGILELDFEIPPAEHVPRVLPKDEDPSLVSRNKRMLGQLLGTLERFRKEDVQRSGTEAYMRRSDSLKRAEQRAREESEKLRLQEREQIAEKRKRDLILRARIAAKAQEKNMELLFLRWSEHHKKLGNFIRTKAEPPIYYSFSKPLDQDATSAEQQKEKMFQEWKSVRREELSQYQKQILEQHLANVDNELERWQNRRKGRRPNNTMANLQETMDKELETHQLEPGPKIRIIPGQSNNEDEDDVEDINVAEDDLMDDVLGVDDNGRRADETEKLDTGNSPPVEKKEE